jgi:NitT/TauT family transport system substrate-binding protein
MLADSIEGVGENVMKHKPVQLLITMALVLVSILTACQSVSPAEEPGPIPVRLTLGFIPNIQFAPIYVALEKGYFTEAGFDVQLEYGNEADAIALIGAGEQTFAVASGEQILLARAQGLPVIYVAAWYDEYPVGVVSLKDQRVRVPENLQGLTVGLPGLYGANYIGFIALLDAAGLTKDDVTLLSIGFNQVEAIVTGQVQSAVVYLANEPVVLQSQGYEVDVVRVADYMQLVSNGLVTNEAIVENNPEMVKAFIGAMLQGIADTAENPIEAYEISKNYVENLAEADTDLQRQILAESIDLWQTDRLGYTDPAGWINMQQVLLSMGLLTEPQDLDKAFTNALLP